MKRRGRKRGNTVISLVQKSLVLGQAVDSVLLNCSLKGRKRIQGFHWSAVRWPDSGVQHPPLPREENVVQSMHKGHQCAEETRTMIFKFKLANYLGRCTPSFWTQVHSLTEELHSSRHRGFFQVSQLNRCAVWMMHNEILEKNIGSWTDWNFTATRNLSLPKVFALFLTAWNPVASVQYSPSLVVDSCIFIM